MRSYISISEEKDEKSPILALLGEDLGVVRCIIGGEYLFKCPPR